MPPITAGQLRAQIETVANRLSQGYTDSEIMRDLKLKRATYFNYKSRVFAIFGDLASRKTEQSLETELELLKDRYIRLYRNLETRIYDKGEELEDVAYATDIAANIATNILRLEAEGLKARQQRSLRQLEQKTVRYLGNTGDESAQFQPQESDTSITTTTTTEPEQRSEQLQEQEQQEPTSITSTEEKVF
jgi:short subunit dehydrogenase-like uncharacterized protein